MTEEWRPIPGYEGSYEVSDHGRVRSVDRVVQWAPGGPRHPNGAICHLKGRMLKPSPGHRGHLAVNLGSKGRNKLVHVLVLEAFVGPCPPGMECRHLDGDSGRNVLSNLCWGTHLENAADMRRHGRTFPGERNGNARLTHAVVSEIRKASGKQRDLARQFGVSQGTIHNIMSRKTYAEVA